MAARRRELLAGVAGRIIEVGAGDGRNFAHYPDRVTEVLAVEPEAYLRRRAQRNASRARVRIDVVDDLPAETGSFDAAVVTLVLCSVPEQMTGLAELRRVLRPGGRLFFLEHVRADTAAARRVQRLADRTLWPRLFGGCHTGRDTVTGISRAGFTIESLRAFRFPAGRIGPPSSPHVLGVASLPR